MDELSPSARIFSVSEITRGIKRTLEGKAEFNNIWLKGEISNLTLHSSGHIYFTLKDEDAVISATFFKYANKNLTFKLKEGMSVLALGSITVFEKRGSYQINVTMVKPEGMGELQKRIEELKQKLLKEGIFDPARKRPLPFLPQRLGIVTSPTGAAVRDIIKVALRRYPNIEIILAPAIVQGDDAPVSIARGIEELNRSVYRIDCIIAGRGGGSFEDLMPFNEEIVVRAFYNSRVPIISAVGHQVDHPLSDDAADAVAPTPSAAAELAIPVKRELVDEIDDHLARMNYIIANRISRLQTKLDGIGQLRVFRDPYEIVNQRELQLSELQGRVMACVKDSLSGGRNRLLSVPDIRMLMRNIIQNKKHAFVMALNSLDQLSPLAVLKRGYSVAMDESKRVIRSVTGTDVGNAVHLLLHDGSLGCIVNSIERGGRHGKEKDPGKGRKD